MDYDRVFTPQSNSIPQWYIQGIWVFGGLMVDHAVTGWERSYYLAVSGVSWWPRSLQVWYLVPLIFLAVVDFRYLMVWIIMLAGLRCWYYSEKIIWGCLTYLSCECDHFWLDLAENFISPHVTIVKKQALKMTEHWYIIAIYQSLTWNPIVWNIDDIVDLLEGSYASLDEEFFPSTLARRYHHMECFILMHIQSL